jgi:dTMP kinase
VAEIVRPALEAGQIVICDRYTDSTLAYQGYGRGRDPDRLRRANDLATGGLQPDLTLLCDLPVSVGLERAGLRNRREGTVLSEGRFDSESLNFHERVRQGYLTIAEEEPDRIAIIDASQQPEDVVLQCLSAVERHLKQRGSGLE